MSKKNVTEKMREFSREKAIFRKVGPKDPITGQWARALNRVVEPKPPTVPARDRSLNGKARVKAARSARALARKIEKVAA